MGTKDSATLARQARADFITEMDRFDREQENYRYRETQNRFYRTRYPARISEIGFFGFKSAEETTATKSDPKPERESELDLILE